MGGVGEDWSGDLFIAFSTGNRGIDQSDRDADPRVQSTAALRMFHRPHITPLFEAVVDSTKEAILNALLAAETMTGRDGITAQSFDPQQLLAAMSSLGRG